MRLPQRTEPVNCSPHLLEFFAANLQLLNDGSEGLAFYLTAVHRYYQACLVGLAHINRVAPRLSPEHKSSSLSNACRVLRETTGKLGSRRNLNFRAWRQRKFRPRRRLRPVSARRARGSGAAGLFPFSFDRDCSFAPG